MQAGPPSFQPLTVHIDGVPASVLPGVSVAAALWNSGVPAARRSITGQPRGALCGMGICFECRASINGVPHERTCMIECVPGMRIETGRVPGGHAPS